MSEEPLFGNLRQGNALDGLAVWEPKPGQLSPDQKNDLQMVRIRARAALQEWVALGASRARRATDLDALSKSAGKHPIPLDDLIDLIAGLSLMASEAGISMPGMLAKGASRALALAEGKTNGPGLRLIVNDPDHVPWQAVGRTHGPDPRAVLLTRTELLGMEMFIEAIGVELEPTLDDSVDTATARERGEAPMVTTQQPVDGAETHWEGLCAYLDGYDGPLQTIEAFGRRYTLLITPCTE